MVFVLPSSLNDNGYKLIEIWFISLYKLSQFIKLIGSSYLAHLAQPINIAKVGIRHSHLYSQKILLNPKPTTAQWNMMRTPASTLFYPLVCLVFVQTICMSNLRTHKTNLRANTGQCAIIAPRRYALEMSIGRR